MIGLGYLMWRQLSPDIRTDNASPLAAAPVVAFLAVEASLFAILNQADQGYSAGLFALITAFILAGLHFASPGRRFDVFYRCAELADILLGFIALTWYGRLRWLVASGRSVDVSRAAVTVGIVLASVALVLLIVVILDRIRLAAHAMAGAVRQWGVPSSTGSVELIGGFGLTLAVIGLLTPYNWFVNHAVWQWGYPVSLAGMVIAIVIVGLGLWSRVKALRLFGLVLTIVCVLKLVTVDIGSVTSVTRVVAFLGGAAACFGISALYNYTAKHFDKELAQAPDAPVPYAGQPLPYPAPMPGASPAPQVSPAQPGDPGSVRPDAGRLGG